MAGTVAFLTMSPSGCAVSVSMDGCVLPRLPPLPGLLCPPLPESPTRYKRMKSSLVGLPGAEPLGSSSAPDALRGPEQPACFISQEIPHRDGVRILKENMKFSSKSKY